MCLKGLVTAAFGSSEPFCMEKWAVWKSGRVVSAPSLHRKSTDSLMIIIVIYVHA